MGTNVKFNQIGSIMQSKGDNVLEKLSQELKQTQSTVTPSSPAQIKAAQQAQTSYGQAQVSIDAKAAKKAKRLAKKVSKAERAIKKAEIRRAKKLAESAKRQAKAQIAAQQAAAQAAEDTAKKAAEKAAAEAAKQAKEQASRQARALYQAKQAAGTNGTMGEFVEKSIIKKPGRQLRKMSEYYAGLEKQAAKKAAEDAAKKAAEKAAAEAAKKAAEDAAKKAAAKAAEEAAKKAAAGAANTTTALVVRPSSALQPNANGALEVVKNKGKGFLDTLKKYLWNPIAAHPKIAAAVAATVAVVGGTAYVLSGDKTEEGQPQQQIAETNIKPDATAKAEETETQQV